MAKKDKIISKVDINKINFGISNPSFGRMGLPMTSSGEKVMLRRRAKFAPQLIADGFRDAVSQNQGNLLKTVFDDPTSDVVDPYTNIHSDKFALMKEGMETTQVDPVPDPEV